MAEERSKVLPTDPFDIALANLTGHPNGGQTAPTIAQSVDQYGNITQHIIQTVRWDSGDTVFITQVNAAGRERFILPPKVLGVIDRQREQVSLQVRRRHGQRLAESRDPNRPNPLLDPKVRAKAAASRKRKAAERKARRERRRAK